MINFEQWEGFEGRIWKEEVNVRDFIQKNYTPYDGDESFLAGPTEATDKLWGALQKLQKAERAKGGVLDMDPHNDKALASKEALDYWSPVDWYNGGMEHTTLHLLYSLGGLSR